MAQIPLFESRGAGWIALSGNFPPTLNKEDAVTELQANESPDCYGIDAQKDGRLKTGSILTGTARNAPLGEGNYTSYNWYYDRLWIVLNSTFLNYGAPKYRNKFFRQGLGKFESHANIVTFLPALQNSMWVVTNTGSHFIDNCTDTRGFFGFNKFLQELHASVANRCVTLDGLPVCSNTSGVFLYDGQKTVELTRKVRDSLGSFSDKAILLDYDKKYIIGTDSYMIDTQNGNLYDYGTSGFRFTSRTLSQGVENVPFDADMVCFIIEHGDTSDGKTIKWQTKVEDNDWYDEENVEINYTEDEFTRIEHEVRNDVRTGHKFAVRVTSVSDNLYIKEIQVRAQNFAVGSFSQ